MFSESIKEINHSENWFLTGKTKEDALKHKIIDNGVINSVVAEPLIKKLNKNSPFLITSFWDGRNDNIMTSNYLCSSFDNFRLTFSLKVKKNVNGLAEKLKNVLLSIVSNKDNIAVIFVQTNYYQMEEKNVFPERIPVGWMLYLNKQITNEQAGVKAELISVSNEKNKGTLIISTNEVFDGTNENHIRNANEIEIQLAAHGLLPTYQNIYD
ncbi:Imm52 family immunity protein [Providencia stuartii]|uniref:Imm52 family immunity protein n=1 Tax=Providencia stuartii TaxID=588 RepID=UPI00331FD808